MERRLELIKRCSNSYDHCLLKSGRQPYFYGHESKMETDRSTSGRSAALGLRLNQIGSDHAFLRFTGLVNQY
jgi:hypothetical protein